MNKISRRDFLKAAGIGAAAMGLAACGSSSSSTAASSAAASTAASEAAVSSWPTDTVSLYVPAKAGGGTDMLVRLFIQGMSEVNGGNYIVVNDTTGSGTVAAETVRNAEPDGLNLLAYHSGICTLVASGQYAHTLDEFQLLGFFSTVTDEATAAIFVPGNSPFDTYEDFVAYCKEHPGELLNGIQQGASSQLTSALLDNAIGIESTMVDVGSNSDKVTALMGNQIDYAAFNITGTSQYVESGDLKCLVQFGKKDAVRCSLVPDVPLLSEIDAAADESMPRLDMYCFIAGPLGMSDADIQEIHNTIKGAIETATVQDGYAQMAAVVEYVPLDECVALMQENQAAYNEAYKLVNG